MDYIDYLISKLDGDKMLLVTGITYITVPTDVWEITNMLHSSELQRYIDMMDKVLSIETEIVKGRRYSNGNNEICLGLSKDVREILSLPFDDFERLQNYCDRVENENSKLQIENQGYNSVIEEINNWSLWKRLKFLFKGKK